MSWLYLPAEAVDSTQACCSDTLPSALSRSSPPTDACCCNARSTGFSHDSPFGMMSEPLMESLGGEALCDTHGDGRNAGRGGDYGEYVRAILASANRWPPEPGVCRVVNGVADWKHRIFALGNGQVPRVAAAAWRMLDRD